MADGATDYGDLGACEGCGQRHRGVTAQIACLKANLRDTRARLERIYRNAREYYALPGRR